MQLLFLKKECILYSQVVRVSKEELTLANCFANCFVFFLVQGTEVFLVYWFYVEGVSGEKPVSSSVCRRVMGMWGVECVSESMAGLSE